MPRPEAAHPPDRLFKDPFLEACKDLSQRNTTVRCSILSGKYFRNNLVQFLLPSGRRNWGMDFKGVLKWKSHMFCF